jgi:hypothetical protein
LLVPAAWKPKQDFDAAAEFIAQHRSPGDAVLCMIGTGVPLQTYLGVDCAAFVRTLPELEHIEAEHERVWMIYTLPTMFEARAPDIWKRIQGSDYTKITEFAGTLNGGDIIVLLKEPPRSGTSPGRDLRHRQE